MKHLRWAVLADVEVLVLHILGAVIHRTADLVGRGPDNLRSEWKDEHILNSLKTSAAEWGQGVPACSVPRLFHRWIPLRT